MSNLPPAEIPRGAIRFNTDSNKPELWDGSQWAEFQLSTPNLGRSVDTQPGARGVFGRQYTPSILSKIEYLNISSTGDSQEFGDLTIARHATAGCSSSTRGIWAGGEGPVPNAAVSRIDYVTIASTGNAINFGDLDTNRRYVRGVANETRGVFAGGVTPAPTTTIQYITIASTGNAVSFGTLTQATDGNGGATAASSTRGLYMGTGDPSGTNVIQFITIHTLGNTQDFGDLTSEGHRSSGGANATRALRIGQLGSSNVIDYVTIASTGNAADFGDMPYTCGYNVVVTSSTRAVSTRGFTGSGYASDIAYVEIKTLGNAVDFGDMVGNGGDSSGFSNAHGGL